MKPHSLFIVIAITILFAGVVCHAASREIKVALFSTFDEKECFLSEAQLEKFSGILERISPDDDPARGKFIPQEFVFYYWEYSKDDKALKRHSISFAANGRSINWRISEADSRAVVALAQDLLKSAKR